MAINKSTIEQLPFELANEYVQSLMIDNVRKILKVKQTNAFADTSALESEIDRLVYQLYGLTEEEIAAVEDS